MDAPAISAESPLCSDVRKSPRADGTAEMRNNQTFPDSAEAERRDLCPSAIFFGYSLLSVGTRVIAKWRRT
jgi:hypothetical protein